MKKKTKWLDYETDSAADGAGPICGDVPRPLILAHAYVPWQCYEAAFSPSEALMKGTLFPELWGVYPIPK